MGWFWLFWYCYDDSIAAFLDVPNLGHVPFGWWLLLLVVFAIGSVSVRTKNVYIGDRRNNDNGN